MGVGPPRHVLDVVSAAAVVTGRVLFASAVVDVRVQFPPGYARKLFRALAAVAQSIRKINSHWKLLAVVGLVGFDGHGHFDRSGCAGLSHRIFPCISRPAARRVLSCTVAGSILDELSPAGDGLEDHVGHRGGDQLVSNVHPLD